MPYKKKYTKKRRAPVRRRAPTRSATYGAAGRQLWKDVMWLKSMVNIEEKYHDSSIFTAKDDTWEVHTPNLIQQGDTATTRDGNSCKIIKYYIKGYLQHNASGSPSQTVRVIIAARKANSTSAMNISQILEGTHTGSDAIIQMYDKVNMSGIRILKDFKITVNTDYPKKYFTHYLPANFHSKFNQAVPVAANVTEGLVQMFYVGDQATGNYPTLAIDSRIVYVDN